jgi:mono/diheme cytochrome c family protein
MSNLAASQLPGIAVAVLGFVLLIAVVVVAARSAKGRRSDRQPKPDIPSAMRPAPSDEDLEGKGLERVKAWGLVVTLFLAIWLPLTWLYEPTTNLNQEKALKAASIVRGENTTQLFSETNPAGFGCVRCHGINLTGGKNLFDAGSGQAIVPVPNLRTVCGGASTGHPNIKSLQDVQDTIMQGREGTDMPSWSIRYKGAMDDQQIEDVVNYLVSIQQVPYSQNVCINPKAGSPTPAPAASGSPSASASTSPSAGSGSSPAAASSSSSPSPKASP